MKTTNPRNQKDLGLLLLWIGIAALVCALVFLIASCNDGCPDRTASEVVVLYDVTEAQIAQPQADELIALYALDTNKWNGAFFSFAYLTDVSYTKRTHFALAPGGNRLTSSSFTRDREVRKFEDSIGAFIGTLAIDTAGRPHSSIWLPIATELVRLAKSAAAERTLIVYGDLMENDPSLSFYDKRTFANLSTDPEKITDLLLAKAPLPNDLSGIRVLFVFEAANAQTDERFRIVASYYTALLASRGAEVIVAANVTARNNVAAK